jgi:hypothetical protein
MPTNVSEVVLHVRCQQCRPPSLINIVAFSLRLLSFCPSDPGFSIPRLGCQNYSLPHDSLGCQGYGLKMKSKKYERIRDGPGREEMIASPYRYIYLSRMSRTIPSNLYQPNLEVGRHAVMLRHHHVQPSWRSASSSLNCQIYRRTDGNTIGRGRIPQKRQKSGKIGVEEGHLPARSRSVPACLVTVLSTPFARAVK